MARTRIIRCLGWLLWCLSVNLWASEEVLHVVASDDCGVNGKQRHLVSGLNWIFTEDEISATMIPLNSPLRSVSYGSTVLYRYSGLKTDARYKVRLHFLTDRNRRYQLVTIDNHAVGDTIALLTSDPRVETFDVPQEVYNDGQIDVLISLVRGRNAVVSEIELLSDAEELLTVLTVTARTDFAGMVFGQICDLNTGNPIHGASVVASLQGLTPVRTSTNGHGEFTFRAPDVWATSREEFVQLRVSRGDAFTQAELSRFELFPETDPLTVLPEHVRGVQQCRISLNGEWQFALNPDSAFWRNDASAQGWKPIRVPGECRMQGFAIEHDREYAYRTMIDVPSDFKGKRVVIRFDGVYSFARVWVNGRYVRSHHGGFTAWECDITRFVESGDSALLVVGITDRVDEISFGSGYAKHPIGGILRNVELIALPWTYIRNFTIDTHVDDQSRDAVLRVECALSSPVDASIDLHLTDPEGKSVRISPSSLSFTTNSTSTSVRLPIASPVRWDAEHPQLYTLEARLIVKGNTEEVVRQRIGLREIRVQGTQLVVNGMPVKLRGACRHDIHPLLGRSTTPEQDRTDVLLAKEANFNFIRTSHYPPSREFLEYCDEYGIYVEEEAAVCFVGTFREGRYKADGSSQDDTRFTERYLSQLAEMIDRDRNHPSVIIWSIGNENIYGLNFKREFDYVKNVDSSRPVMFSFPNTVPNNAYSYDILSVHYPSFDRCITLSEEERKAPIPVLSDEWMHVPCYCVQDLKEDPNIRNFWGESIRRAWDNNVDSDCSIGGAIWGMIDEVFLLPDTCSGYGPWGIVDVWRRKKPEFWHTRKAYSPVRLLATEVEGHEAGKDILLPVHNRFDHTNMRDIRVVCESGETSTVVASPDIAPHSRGKLRIPAEAINDPQIKIRFIDRRDRVVDEEVVTVAATDQTTRGSEKELRIEESSGDIVARGEQFSVTFDKNTGLITTGSVDGGRIIEGGPFVRLVVPEGAGRGDVDSLLEATGQQWKPDSIRIRQSGKKLEVAMRGHAGIYDVGLHIAVTGDGEIITEYEIGNPPESCQEAGIQFLLNSSLDRLSWNRRALWSSYPADHIGRPAGEVPKFAATAAREVYRQRPEWSWSMDTKDFYLFPNENGMQPARLPVPHDFRAMKENILQYALWNQENGAGLRVVSDGTLAARTQVQSDGALKLLIDNHWTYLNLNWGNYERPANMTSPNKGMVKVRLCRVR